MTVAPHTLTGIRDSVGWKGQWQHVPKDSDSVIARLAIRVGDGGIFLNAIGLRGLAVHLQRDIVVLSSTAGAPTIYPGLAEALCWAHRPNIQLFGAGFLCTAGRRSNMFMPATALEENSIVIMHNGTDHFWYTALQPGIDMLALRTNCQHLVDGQMAKLIPFVPVPDQH
jgi:hypothetical protein